MGKFGRLFAAAALCGGLGWAALPAAAEESMTAKQIDALRGKDAAAKIAAAKELGAMKLGALPAVPPLVEALADSDAGVKEAAGAALKEIVGTADPKFTTTGSGLKYLDYKAGDGAAARAGQTVEVHYTGWLVNGNKFDSSRDRPGNFEFPLGARRVIKGWDEGVAGMKPGQRRLLVCSPDLAYGPREFKDRNGVVIIPSNATLIFDVELLRAE